MSKRLTSSPRAFKVSVCPAATVSKKTGFECLVFALKRSFVGKSFTDRPTRSNRQDSVIKDHIDALASGDILPRDDSSSSLKREAFSSKNV